MRSAPKQKAPILQLVPAQPCADTVDTLAYLLHEARAGRVIGLAWVAMHKAYDYSVDVAGEARRSPTLTRGMLRLLDDRIGELLRGR